MRSIATLFVLLMAAAPMSAWDSSCDGGNDTFDAGEQVTAVCWEELRADVDANGVNCQEGFASRGIDGAHAAEGCFDAFTQAEADVAARVTYDRDLAFLYTPSVGDCRVWDVDFEVTATEFWCLARGATTASALDVALRGCDGNAAGCSQGASLTLSANGAKSESAVSLASLTEGQFFEVCITDATTVPEELYCGVRGVKED